MYRQKAITLTQYITYGVVRRENVAHIDMQI